MAKPRRAYEAAAQRDGTRAARRTRRREFEPRRKRFANDGVLKTPSWANDGVLNSPSCANDGAFHTTGTLMPRRWHTTGYQSPRRSPTTACYSPSCCRCAVPFAVTHATFIRRRPGQFNAETSLRKSRPLRAVRGDACV